MRVCYYGTYREEYPRNRILIEGLRRVGVEVVECHAALWHGDADRSRALAGNWLNPLFWLRVLAAYGSLVWKSFHIGDFDILVVGYPGAFDVPLAQIVCRVKRRKLVWDVLMSIHQVGIERQAGGRRFAILPLLRWAELSALAKVDGVLVDSDTYARFLDSRYPGHREMMHVVPLGADDRLFQPVEPEPAQDGRFHVLYYGSFVPNHGLDVILEAAESLRAETAITFDLVGDGPGKTQTEQAVRERGLENVRFHGYLEGAAFMKLLSQAGLCLGSFGGTTHARISVNNKIFECLAAGRPVLTGDSESLREAFQPGRHLFACAREGKALAGAIRELSADPRRLATVARAGHELYQERYRPEVIGARLKQVLLEVSGDTER